MVACHGSSLGLERVWPTDPSELSLAKYMAEVFRQPIPTIDTASIGDYLTYRLNGTPYMSATGFMRQTAKLDLDMKKCYADYPYKRMVPKVRYRH